MGIFHLCMVFLCTFFTMCTMVQPWLGLFVVRMMPGISCCQLCRCLDSDNQDKLCTVMWDKIPMPRFRFGKRVYECVIGFSFDCYSERYLLAKQQWKGHSYMWYCSNTWPRWFHINIFLWQKQHRTCFFPFHPHHHHHSQENIFGQVFSLLFPMMLKFSRRPMVSKGQMEFV